VPAAPPIKYVLGYRSRTLTLNPNPITDPNRNPKNNKKENNTGMKLNIELYLKVDFVGTGGFIRSLLPETELKHIWTVPTSSRSCW